MSVTRKTIRKVISERGKAKEHLMLILRDIETLSGNNQLSEETLGMVAEEMNIPTSWLAGFVGFYTMFSTKPRARYVIRVCKSGPCNVMGATTIFKSLEKLLGIKPGEATKDGLFFLEKCECLGVCSAAPAMMVNYDLHGKLTEKKLEKLIEGYRKRTPSVRENSGPEIEGRECVIKEGAQTRRLTEGMGSLDPLRIESYMERKGYEALRKALKEMTPEQVVQTVKDSGLRGRGGAGFPAGLKWSFMPKGDMPKFTVCNADEGEPGTYKDRILMEENPHQLLEGMTLAAYGMGSQKGYIYVRGEFRRAIDRLQAGIEQARAKGFLGKNICGSGFCFDIFIKEGGGAYVCGEESSLINSMEGKRGYPRFRPPFPAGSGFMKLPTTVNNVETYASAPMIILNGADWYKSVGTPKCPGTKLYCLSGKLKFTGLVELPMGSTLRRIIDEFGGGMKNRKKFKFAQVGGTAGGILGPELLDLPLDIDQTIAAGVTLGSGVVLVCDEETCPVDFLLNVLAFFEHESCGQCVPCRVGTSRLHHLAKKLARRSAVPEEIELMTATTLTMKKASLCALGQSPIMPVTTILKNFRSEFEKHCDPGYKCKSCDATLRMFYGGR